jgi:hypothetical protein
VGGISFDRHYSENWMPLQMDVPTNGSISSEVIMAQRYLISTAPTNMNSSLQTGAIAIELPCKD